MIKNPLPMSEMQETRIQHLGWEDSLKEQVATHPRMVAWLIPWIEEPSGLQFMGLQRMEHGSMHACLPVQICVQCFMV